MPPVYLGDQEVTVYKGDVPISSLGIGDIVVEVYTTTTTTPTP